MIGSKQDGHVNEMAIYSTASTPYRSEPCVKPRFDCSTCPGYCCSHPLIAVTDFDIKRLAKHFDLSPSAAKKKFTYHYVSKEYDEQVLRHQKDHVYKSV